MKIARNFWCWSWKKNARKLIKNLNGNFFLFWTVQARSHNLYHFLLAKIFVNFQMRWLILDHCEGQTWRFDCQEYFRGIRVWFLSQSFSSLKGQWKKNSCEPFSLYRLIISRKSLLFTISSKNLNGNSTWHCTLVDLSTRMVFLNIGQSLYIRVWWSWNKYRDINKCMLSFKSGFKRFRVPKKAILGQIFWTSTT